jgi:hypothetical protein
MFCQLLAVDYIKVLKLENIRMTTTDNTFTYIGDPPGWFGGTNGITC